MLLVGPLKAGPGQSKLVRTFLKHYLPFPHTTICHLNLSTHPHTGHSSPSLNGPFA